MIARLEHANSQLYSNFIFSTRETLIQFAKASKESGVTVESKQPKTSWIVIVCALLIATACIVNTVHNIWFSNKDYQTPIVEQQYNDDQKSYAIDSVAVNTAIVDSIVSNK